MRCCVRSSPRTSRRLYSCTYRPSHAHRDRATYLNHLIRKYWCSGSKRVQATLRAEDHTRLLLDFSHTTRLISAFAPLRTWLRANTLAFSELSLSELSFPCGPVCSIVSSFPLHSKIVSSCLIYLRFTYVACRVRPSATIIPPSLPQSVVPQLSICIICII